MRLLVLIAALLISAGSFQTANQRYAVRSYACSSSTTMTPAQRQNCTSSANVQYAVESQRELVAEQNARQDQMVAQANQEATARENGRRCEAVARAMLLCQLITPSQAENAIDNCRFILAQPTGHPYGQFLCYEAAADCDGMRWCQTH
jgi:hypothetical protein